MTRPRIGFLGVGWIGRNRMEAIVATGAIEAAAICDPSPECIQEARQLAPAAEAAPTLEAMLGLGLDGVVIATPSALHAEQAIAALERGIAVFCQKPLGRNAAEAQAVVSAAERADRLLGVDLSYRHTAATRAIAPLVRGGIGKVFAADLTFHNAYGPDKAWFYSRAQSGGGCVIDLGVHLVDLALWLLDFPEIEAVSSRLYAGGELLAPGSEAVEDYAVARLDLAGGRTVRLTCSWNLHAGREAVIEADFYGAEGAAGFRNLGGSFFDFEAAVNRGTMREVLASAPDEWGGRAAAEWATRLAQNPGFDPAARELVAVSRVLDAIYHGGVAGA
jgi:predicted dehydrogenase